MQIHYLLPIALLSRLTTAYPKLQSNDLDEQYELEAKQHPLLQARASPSPGVSHSRPSTRPPAVQVLGTSHSQPGPPGAHAHVPGGSRSGAGTPRPDAHVSEGSHSGPSTPRPDRVHSDLPRPAQPALGTRTPPTSPGPNAPTRNLLGLTIDPTELGDPPSLHDGSSAPHRDEGSAAASRRHGPPTPHFLLHCDTNPTIGNRCNAECTCDVSGQVGCNPRQNARNEPNGCFRICRCEAGDSKHGVSVVTDAEDPLQAAVVGALMDTRL